MKIPPHQFGASYCISIAISQTTANYIWSYRWNQLGSSNSGARLSHFASYGPFATEFSDRLGYWTNIWIYITSMTINLLCSVVFKTRWNCASNTNYRIATTTSHLCSWHLSPGNNVEANCFMHWIYLAESTFHRHISLSSCFRFISFYFALASYSFLLQRLVFRIDFMNMRFRQIVCRAQVSVYCLLLAICRMRPVP